MAMQHRSAAKTRPLNVLGIGEQEEQAYRRLLDHPGASVAEISRALSLSPNKAKRLLDSIEAKGLATHSPQRPRRYTPASPDIALKALSFQRQEELQRADGVIQELQKRLMARRPASEGERMAEIIMGGDAARHVLKQMHLSAQHEVLALVRPPVLSSRMDVSAEEDHHEQMAARNRGVSFRTIIDAEFMNLPFAVSRIREEMQSGENIRIVPHLPFKMITSDHRLAVIPLNFQEPEGPTLLVRSSVFLDALYLLFEFIWERAVPVSFTRTGALDTRNHKDKIMISEEAENLLSLLAAGMNDKRIAAELEISRSTYSRRIAEIMKMLNAGSRFQLGWLAREYVSSIIPRR